jgi:hypothetical protein
MDIKRVMESLSEGQSIQNESEISTLIQEQEFQQGLEKYLPSIKIYERLRDSLDAIKKENVKDIQFDKAVVGSAIAASTGLSIGYVVWLIRGGMLLTSVLSSMPAWQIADPLPVLARIKDDSDPEDDETLETIIEKGSRNDDNKEKKSGKDDGSEHDDKN